MNQKLKLNDGLTYEEIIQRTQEKEPPEPDRAWDYYVHQAKNLLASTHFNRMAIAEMAVRACAITGGKSLTGEDRWLQQFNGKISIRSFAEQIGINPSTLSLWVRIKQDVFNNLEPGDRHEFKHDAGEKAYKLVGKSPAAKQVRDAYHKQVNLSKSDRSCLAALRACRQLYKFFAKTDFVHDLSDKQLEMVLNASKRIFGRCVEIKELRSKKIKPSTKKITRREVRL